MSAPSCALPSWRVVFLPEAIGWAREKADGGEDGWHVPSWKKWKRRLDASICPTFVVACNCSVTYSCPATRAKIHNSLAHSTSPSLSTSSDTLLLSSSLSHFRTSFSLSFSLSLSPSSLVCFDDVFQPFLIFLPMSSSLLLFLFFCSLSLLLPRFVFLFSFSRSLCVSLFHHFTL